LHRLQELKLTWCSPFLFNRVALVFRYCMLCRLIRFLGDDSQKDCPHTKAQKNECRIQAQGKLIVEQEENQPAKKQLPQSPQRTGQFWGFGFGNHGMPTGFGKIHQMH
jgi:hypothetical protein